MRKFKVGDKVRVIGGAYSSYTTGSPYNLPRIPGEVKESGDCYIKINYNGTISPPVNPSFFTLEGNTSLIPTRIITRKEVVPGGYGIVFVTKENKILIQRGSYSHGQLREAAHILNQIAEALEDETTN